jgi:hypothetical protein
VNPRATVEDAGSQSHSAEFDAVELENLERQAVLKNMSEVSLLLSLICYSL